MKMYYIANARLPTEKAHGIQIAKMCEAFISQGIDVVVVAPRRKTSAQSMKEFYGLSHAVPLVRLPVLDWYTKGRLGFVLSSVSFMLSYLVYLGWKTLSGKEFRLYTVDMDTFSFVALRLLGRPCVIEVHNKLPSAPATRVFFKKANVVAINNEVRDTLQKIFKLERILVEPNGVDVAAFALNLSQHEARQKLALPGGPLALYVGRIYAWKELGILTDATGELSGIKIYLIGGTREEFMRVTGRKQISESLHFVPEVAPAAVPLWLAAADVLLVLGSKKNESSFRYTAPMKVFEYMAARRPVVASATPALKGIISPDDVLWYAPDNAHDLAKQINRTLTEDSAERVARAYSHAKSHDWRERAARIAHKFFSTQP